MLLLQRLRVSGAALLLFIGSPATYAFNTVVACTYVRFCGWWYAGRLSTARAKLRLPLPQFGSVARCLSDVSENLPGNGYGP
eukprot:7301292-Pyramimonas_sp.AAC.2